MEKLELYRAYFEDEIEYYENQLKKFETNGKCSFNFWTGFFGMSWFMYRKMYLQAIIIAIILFIISIISAIFLQLYNTNDSTNETYNFLIIYIISFITLGFIGNTSYIKKSIKVVNEFINKNGQGDINPAVIKNIKNLGGTSFTSAIIFIVGMYILQMIIKYLL